MSVETVASIRMNSSLPTEQGTFGVWVKDTENSDVHVYMSKDLGVVIGNNQDYKTMKFTPLAVVFNKAGTINVQYADESGEVAFAELNPDTFNKLAKEFLERCVAEAKSAA